MNATYPNGKASRRLDPRSGMNRTEAKYAEMLEADRVKGKIVRWDYEPETLKLADDTRYTPDFRVVLPDGTIEFHEVKGGKNRKVVLPDGSVERRPVRSGNSEDDAWAKFKIAATLHPYVFRLCVHQKSGWTISEAGNRKGY